MTDLSFDMEDKENEFMQLLGRCISSWSRVEEELFKICMAILRVSKQHTSIIYFRTPSISARLELTTEFVETIFPYEKKPGSHPPDGLVAWKKLRKSIGEDFAVRNQLAHSPVMPSFASDSETEPESWEIKFENSVSNMEKWRGRSEDKVSLGIKDLELHLDAVHRHYEALNNFRYHVLPKNAEPSQPRREETRRRD